MSATAYSVVITTFNNAATLARCLESVRDAPEVLVLDSGSSDATVAIAENYGARVATHPFQGYGAQKQMAVSLALHEWVLLLDADEALTPRLAAEIDALMTQPLPYTAYKVRRREQLFWRWQHRATKLVDAVRLFDRRHAALSHEAVHAGVVAHGPVGMLRGVLLHYGETDLHHKVARVNAYSSGMVQDRLSRRPHFLRLRMVAYPLFAFWREYLLRRQFLNGWAGFMAARVSAFYAFLKYAKLYDARQSRGSDLLDRRDEHYRPPGDDPTQESGEPDT